MTNLEQRLLLEPEQYDDQFGEIFEAMRENGADNYAEELLDAIGDAWELHKVSDYTWKRYLNYPAQDTEEVVEKVCDTCRNSEGNPHLWPCDTARALMNGVGVVYP